MLFLNQSSTASSSTFFNTLLSEMLFSIYNKQNTYFFLYLSNFPYITHPPISPHHAIYLCLCVVKLRNSEARARGQVDRPAAPTSVPVILRSLPLPLPIPPQTPSSPLPPSSSPYCHNLHPPQHPCEGKGRRRKWKGKVGRGVWGSLGCKHEMYTV